MQGSTFPCIHFLHYFSLQEVGVPNDSWQVAGFGWKGHQVELFGLLVITKSRVGLPWTCTQEQRKGNQISGNHIIIIKTVEPSTANYRTAPQPASPMSKLECVTAEYSSVRTITAQITSFIAHTSHINILWNYTKVFRYRVTLSSQKLAYSTLKRRFVWVCPTLAFICTYCCMQCLGSKLYTADIILRKEQMRWTQSEVDQAMCA